MSNYPTPERGALLEYARLRGLIPTVAALAQAADQRGIPWIVCTQRNLIRLGQGRHQKLLLGTVTSQTNRDAIELAADKARVNQLLSSLRLPVPRQHLARSREEAVRAAARIGHPVVIKPLRAAHGEGVWVRPAPAQVGAAFERARRHGPAVVVEKFIPGHDYRMLVVNDRLVAVARRVPAHVVGNATDTIAQLIQKTNQDPCRGPEHENVLTCIALDSEAERLLALRNYCADTVPAAGEVVYLRETANLSTGGTAMDVTELVHPDNARLARKAVRVLGLDVGGVDFITEDLSKSYRTIGGAICEVNAAPSLRMHLAPSEGARRNVAGPIIDMLFPAGALRTIPIIAVVGARGGGMTSYLVAQILRRAGYTVGLSNVNGTFIDGRRLARRGSAEMQPDRRILIDETVDAAVYQSAHHKTVTRDDYGRPNVAIYLDLETLCAEVASVARDVTVLNADDPCCLAVATSCPSDRLCLISTKPDNFAVTEHVQRGGWAVLLDSPSNLLRFHRGGLGCGGLSTPQILITARAVALQSPVLAAAAAFAMGIDCTDIAWGLGVFVRRAGVPGRRQAQQGPRSRIVDVRQAGAG